MEPAYLSAFAALAGSTIGGLTSLTASWLTQHVQFSAQQRAGDLMRVLSSPTIVEHADSVVRVIIETYLSPNKTFRDVVEILDNDLRRLDQRLCASRC